MSQTKASSRPEPVVGRLLAWTTASRRPVAERVPYTSSRCPRSRPIMSMLTEQASGLPARDAGLTRTKWEDPSSPFSSPSQNANRIDRRGREGRCFIASAISRRPATPDALSSAPLWTWPKGP